MWPVQPYSQTLGPHVFQVPHCSLCKGSEAGEAQADESQVSQELSLALGVGPEQGHPLVWKFGGKAVRK